MTKKEVYEAAVAELKRLNGSVREKEAALNAARTAAQAAFDNKNGALREYVEECGIPPGEFWHLASS